MFASSYSYMEQLPGATYEILKDDGTTAESASHLLAI
jgi:hypothetical protein